MSDVRVFYESEFPTIHCTKLSVHPVTTDLKWDPSKRHPGLDILGYIDTVKSIISEDTRGIIANTGYLIGSNESAWYFIINETSSMYFGVSLQNQDLSDINTVAIKQLLNVTQSDRVRVSLTTGSTMSIRHERRNGELINSYMFNMSQYNTQTLYPWVSSQRLDSMSVTIMQDVKFSIDVRTDGLVRMSGSNNDIIDFSLEDIYNNNGIPSGGGGPSSDIISNTVSGAYVKATEDGEIDMSGGVKYKCENIVSSVPTYILNKNQHIVIITNPVIINVQLPEVADLDRCRTYTVIRNYNLQIGETWQNPVLKVIPNPGDTIELGSHIGLPYHTKVELISDSINDWRIN
jgi:hypothetical protein